MLKNDLILRNPLNLLRDEKTSRLIPGDFGAVLARAGVGKTAFLVQISLRSLLRGSNVLHISLNEPVDKVAVWYDAVFTHLAKQYQLEKVHQLWEDLFPHRFIMTFKVDSFSALKLEERLTDLVEQNIFTPRMIIIDGLSFEQSIDSELENLKTLSQKYASPIWFTVRTHRSEQTPTDELPASLADIAHLFKIIVRLEPDGEEIYVKLQKGTPPVDGPVELLLDPSTMLIKDRG